MSRVSEVEDWRFGYLIFQFFTSTRIGKTFQKKNKNAQANRMIFLPYFEIAGEKHWGLKSQLNKIMRIVYSHSNDSVQFEKHKSVNFSDFKPWQRFISSLKIELVIQDFFVMTTDHVSECSNIYIESNYFNMILKIISIQIFSIFESVFNFRSNGNKILFSE